MYKIKINKLVLCFVFSLAMIVGSTDSAGANLMERTGSGSIPCDPKTDFVELYMVDNWEKLPHKCQEESRERVAEVNSMLTRKKWSYRKMVPVLACLSFATSEVADWWALQYGQKLSEYTNFYNGKVEQGFNPREFEVAYLTRSKKQSRIKYPVVPFPDFVHKRAFPASNRGYARILTEPFNGTLKDTILPDVTYEYTEDKYPFEPGRWLRFRCGVKSNKKYTEIVKRVIHAHGPLLTHVEFVSSIRHLVPAIHSVIIVGYGRLASDPDETVFILQDSYGDHPKDYHEEDGGPAYKYFKGKYLETVIAFPHTPVVKASKKGGKLLLNITNKAGEPLKVNTLAVFDTAKKVPVRLTVKPDKNGLHNINLSDFAHESGKVLVYVAADYYMKNPDEGYWFNLKL